MELPPGAIISQGMVGEYVQQLTVIDCKEQGGQNYDLLDYMCMLTSRSYTLIVMLGLLDPSGNIEDAQRIVLRKGDTLCVPRGNIYVSRTSSE